MVKKKESPASTPAPKKKSALKTRGRQPKAPNKKPAEIGVVPVVGIGASAGGLDALSKFFQAMPADSGNAFVVVQHLDPHHKSLMADLLAKHTAMEVVQAESSMAVEPNHVYVIAPNTYLTLADGELRVSEPITVRGMRMPIDYFFRSLGEARQEKAICIVLSGTATDGTLGLRAVKSHGGLALVQDPTTATHDGMPVSAISTGMVDLVLPVEEMPEAIVKYVQHPFIRNAAKATPIPEHAQTDLQSIFSLLRARAGHDFKWYKKTTLVRRIQRRIGLHHFDTYGQYTSYLRDHPQEVNQLFKDLLISVTDWFRDPQAWEDLKGHALPQLFERQGQSSHPLRVWVPGCATGEEAFSLAILLNEEAEERQESPDFLIFATDVNRDSLELARNGVYPDAIADQISPERLARYFRSPRNDWRGISSGRANFSR
ncbi:MAG: chemotaxis protein CheB [Deltaproteobacteria bacterium]